MSQQKSLIIVLFPFITIFYSLSSQAQILPRLNPPPLEKPIDIKPLPSLEEVLPEIQPIPNQPSPLEQIPGQIIVKQFDVIGSTVFSSQQLTTLLEPYTNKPISFAQLVKAQEDISKLYIQNGYVTSGAFIPPQTLEDGIVKIQVIEGRVENIEVEGLERLHSGYIRSRLEIASKAPLNQEKLLNALQILQLNPLISNITAELSAGTQPGTSILAIKVTEAPAFSALASYDNYRNPSVGTNRILGQITHDNLLGWGDQFNVTYYNTEGSDNLDDLSYTLPVNAYNGTVNARFRLTNSKVIEPIFEPFDLTSQYRQYQLTYRQPIIETPNQEFALGITTDWQTSANFLLDEPFPLSRGADSDGKVRIFALRFFQEYNRRNQREVFVARSQFNVGMSAFGATNNNDGIPDSDFFSWRGQTQYINLLTPDILLLLRADLQLAPQALLPVEQFSLGGVYSVRGYSQDVLLADNGLFASAEIRANILKIPKWNTTLQLSPFFDIGTVWNSDDIPLQRNTLYSTGLGLRLSIGNTFNARLDWGIPLVDIVDNNNTLQSDGLYFSFQLTPFK